MQDTAVIMRAAASSHSSQHLRDINQSSDPSLARSTSELSDHDSGISSNRSSSSSMEDSHCKCQGHPSEVNAQNGAADREINEGDEDGGREYDLDLESHSENTDKDNFLDDYESTPDFGIEDAIDRLTIMYEEHNSFNEDLNELGPGQKRSKGDDCETNSQSHTQSKRPAGHPPTLLSLIYEFRDDESHNSDSREFQVFGSPRASHNSRQEMRLPIYMQQQSTSTVPPPRCNLYGQRPEEPQITCGPPSSNGRQGLQSKSSSSTSSLSDLSDHVDTDGEACNLSIDIMESMSKSGSSCQSPPGIEMPAVPAQEIEGAGPDVGGASSQFAATLNCNDIRQRSVDKRNTDLYPFPLDALQTEQPFMNCSSELPLNPSFADSPKNNLTQAGLPTPSRGKSDYLSPGSIVQWPPSVLCSSSVSSLGFLKSHASLMSSLAYNQLQSPQGSLRSPDSLASPVYNNLEQSPWGSLRSPASPACSRQPHSPQGSLKCPDSLASPACSSLQQSPPDLSPHATSPRSQNYSLPPTPASTDSESQSYITGTRLDVTDPAVFCSKIMENRLNMVFPVHIQPRQDTSLERFDIREIEEVIEETESEDEQAISLTESPLPPHLYHILWDVNGHWRKDESGETFLHSLAGFNEYVAVTNLHKMRGLPGFEVAINDYNKAKETPLYCAVYLRKYQLVKAFGEVGANVNTECCHHDKAQMPIHHAVEHSDIQMVSTLLDSFPYIDINARRPYDKLTALMVALLKHGTAVGTQRQNITFAIVQRLFEYTVKHDISGLKIVDPKNGKTPLMMAVETKDLRIVSHFLTHINDVDKTRELINMQSKSGNSALHLAAGLRGLNDEVKGQMLRRLIMAGGDTNKKNIEGETPKDWARNIIDQVAKIK